MPRNAQSDQDCSGVCDQRLFFWVLFVIFGRNQTGYEGFDSAKIPSQQEKRTQDARDDQLQQVAA